MKTNKIDSSKFPIRKVVSVRDANKGAMSAAMGVAKFVTLDCGHVVGVKVGADVPTEVGCYWCYKDAAQ